MLRPRDDVWAGRDPPHNVASMAKRRRNAALGRGVTKGNRGLAGKVRQMKHSGACLADNKGCVVAG